MARATLDRRVQKTRKLLQEALIELVAQQGYEAVTIREILDKANVGRSTFYAHFHDKDQLLHSILESLQELFEEHNQRLLKAPAHMESAGSLTFSLFQFVGQHHRFFKAMLEKRGYGIFTKPIYDYVFAHVRAMLTKPIPAEAFVQLHGPFETLRLGAKARSLEVEIAAHYFVSAFMGILVWWVERDMPCTAEEIDRVLKELALPGFRRVVDLKPATQSL